MTLEEETLKKARQGGDDLRQQGDVLQKVVEEAVRKVLDGPLFAPSTDLPFSSAERGKGPLADVGPNRESIFLSDPKMGAAQKRKMLCLTAALKERFSKEERKAVLFTAADSGSGTSTLCAWSAASLAAMTEGNVLILDGNLEHPALHRLFGVESAPGLSEVLEGRIRKEEALRKSDRVNFYLLPSGEPVFEPWRWPGWEGWPALLTLLKADFDFIFIDAPSLLESPEVEWMLPWADASVLVLRAGLTSLVTARRAVREIKRRKGFLGVIWNG